MSQWSIGRWNISYDACIPNCDIKVDGQRLFHRHFTVAGHGAVPDCKIVLVCWIRVSRSFVHEEFCNFTSSFIVTRLSLCNHLLLEDTPGGRILLYTCMQLLLYDEPTFLKRLGSLPNLQVLVKAIPLVAAGSFSKKINHLYHPERLIFSNFVHNLIVINKLYIIVTRKSLVYENISHSWV